MKLEIAQWLSSNRDYGTGSALYNRFGSNQVLKQLFAHGDYSFTRRKLEAALELLLEQALAAPEQPVALPATTPAPVPMVATATRQQMGPFRLLFKFGA